MLANPNFIINRQQLGQHNALQGKTLMHLEENKSDLLGIIKKGDRDQDRKRLTMMDMHNRGGKHIIQ